MVKQWFLVRTGAPNSKHYYNKAKGWICMLVEFPLTLKYDTTGVTSNGKILVPVLEEEEVETICNNIAQEGYWDRYRGNIWNQGG